ncbi:MAG: hypothetical protein E7273_06275 [Pseudobutyrivibrio ruminis]|nr:hypothetical protein [Pseudobutyrivibrio ruminis]
MLEAFRFRWRSAFRIPDNGIDTIIETTTGGKCRINMIADGVPSSIEVNEEQFLNELLSVGVEKWDSCTFGQLMEDGVDWSLNIKYDDKEINCDGSNGYPAEFLDFLAVLKKYGFDLHGWTVSKNEIRRSKKYTHKKEKSRLCTYYDIIHLEDL